MFKLVFQKVLVLMGFGLTFLAQLSKKLFFKMFKRILKVACLRQIGTLVPHVCKQRRIKRNKRFFAIFNANFSKLWLLIWKNCLLQYRKPLQTLIEIIAPVMFAILLVIMRSMVDPETQPTKTFHPFCPLPLNCEDSFVKNASNFKSPLKQMTLVYSPSGNNALNRSMSILNLIFGSVIGYENQTMLENHFSTKNSTNTFAGVQLHDSLSRRNDIPHNVEVSLRFPGEQRTYFDSFDQNSWYKNFFSTDRNRTTHFKNRAQTLIEVFQTTFLQKTWKTNMLYPLWQTAGPRKSYLNYGGDPGYFTEGFLTLQMIVAYALMFEQILEGNKSSSFQTTLSNLKLPIVKMQRFPSSSWTEDLYFSIFERYIGTIILMSFVYTCINTVKIITVEKEKQLKEAMKIMGLPNWMHWTAWFLKSFIFLFMSMLLLTFLLKVPWYSDTAYSIFTHSDASVLLAFFLLYCCAIITFCFAVSVFFSKANTAAAAAGLLWFLLYCPYLFLQEFYEETSLATKMGSSLGCNTAMAYGVQLILMFENANQGATWANIWQPVTADDTLTLGHIMTMLVIDALLYLIIALYVDVVLPGEYGVSLPWYFPLAPSYWRKSCNFSKTLKSLQILNNNKSFIEENPSYLTIGIQLESLSKQYGTKIAVEDLSLNMYHGQITVLLGHNGAGKTTTLSMLTGMAQPTTGSAYVEGLHIRRDIHRIRANIGLCPQHNILFDELTVREHLYFFSKLKGLAKEHVNREVQKYIYLLGLQEKKDSLSSTLSGGMKRKLCVGIALCGNSKILILDEPTAGMDPESRRILWDLLQNEKKNRTILLTTHFMDEADLLGDRIAIMAKGKLKCCGSSFFLKKKFGAGYHLTIDKSPNCQINNITNLLQTYIPTIQINNNAGSKLSYLLSENQTFLFQKMLEDLEQHSQDLGISSYGISLTSLEEVYLKVVSESGTKTYCKEEQAFLDYASQTTNNLNHKDFKVDLTVSSNGKIKDAEETKRMFKSPTFCAIKSNNSLSFKCQNFIFTPGMEKTILQIIELKSKLSVFY